MYNGLLTSMSVGSELSRYGAARKPLRVSAPIGMQRSSYFLSLPYRFGVPLSICSGLMRWFISQSVFFVRTVAYNSDGTKDPPNDTSGVGFSPIGIIFAFSLAVTMLLPLGVVAFVKKYPDTIPLMSTNSAAISAACHPPADDIDAYLLPVQWGVDQPQRQHDWRMFFYNVKWCASSCARLSIFLIIFFGLLSRWWQQICVISFVSSHFLHFVLFVRAAWKGPGL